jgi:hypothetical protein
MLLVSGLPVVETKKRFHPPLKDKPTVDPDNPKYVGNPFK